MSKEIKILTNEAANYYISHPEHSFAIFSISSVGDLMINSDWGQSNYSWRSFGEETLLNFKSFLVGLDEGYWKGKMEYNMHFMKVSKAVINHFTKNVWPLFQILQKHLKSESPSPTGK